MVGFYVVLKLECSAAHWAAFMHFVTFTALPNTNKPLYQYKLQLYFLHSTWRMFGCSLWWTYHSFFQTL